MESAKEEINDWVLAIDKLNISVPIILRVDGADKEAYFNALQGGVAHMKNTALPGEGNTVIFGHSNFYDDDPGQYKQIFSTLDQLVIGDEIKIESKEKTLTYTVNSTNLVNPSDVEVVKPTENKQLTLITCWPPGSIGQRLVVIATLM
jgi:LPXTG-site transpeptidase (sortase) family protein